MLIVLTHPEALANESELLNQLFAEGLECLHLRKPNYSKTEYETILKAIAPEHKRKVVLHQFHELASKYNIKGLHLREESRINLSVSGMKDLKKEMKLKNLTLSSSFHSKAEIEISGNEFNYVFLSPVFDSISKQGYLRNDELGMMNDEWKSKVKTNIIALGGIDSNNIHAIKGMGYDGAAVLAAIWQKPEEALATFANLKKTFINSSNH